MHCHWPDLGYSEVGAGTDLSQMIEADDAPDNTSDTESEIEQTSCSALSTHLISTATSTDYRVLSVWNPYHSRHYAVYTSVVDLPRIATSIKWMTLRCDIKMCTVNDQCSWCWQWIIYWELWFGIEFQENVRNSSKQPEIDLERRNLAAALFEGIEDKQVIVIIILILGDEFSNRLSQRANNISYNVNFGVNNVTLRGVRLSEYRIHVWVRFSKLWLISVLPGWVNWSRKITYITCSSNNSI